MCGRNSLFVTATDVEERFNASFASGVDYTSRYNIAPGSHLEVLTSEDPETIDQFHWGLVPHWADTVDDGFINARSETAAEKPAFKTAWEHRPCLVLSSGFYEWQSPNGGTKRPYRIYKQDQPAFAMAGLWQETEIDDEAVRSVTILTTEPNDTVAPIHDRMPVVLPRGKEEAWLSVEPTERKSLCQPYHEADLDAYEISTRVNNPRNDDAMVIDPMDSQQSGISDFS